MGRVFILSFVLAVFSGLGFAATETGMVIGNGHSGNGNSSPPTWISCRHLFQHFRSGAIPVASLRQFWLNKISPDGTRWYGTWEGNPGEILQEDGSVQSAFDRANPTPQVASLLSSGLLPETRVVVRLNDGRAETLVFSHRGEIDPTFHHHTYRSRTFSAGVGIFRLDSLERLDLSSLFTKPEDILDNHWTVGGRWNVFQLSRPEDLRGAHSSYGLVAVSPDPLEGPRGFILNSHSPQSKLDLLSASDDLNLFVMTDLGTGRPRRSPNRISLFRPSKRDPQTLVNIRGPRMEGRNPLLSPSQQYLAIQSYYPSHARYTPLIQLFRIGERISRLDTSELNYLVDGEYHAAIESGQIDPEFRVQKMLFSADERWLAVSFRFNRRVVNPETGHNQSVQIFKVARLDMRNPAASPMIFSIDPKLRGPLANPDFTLLPNGDIRAATADARGIFIFESDKAETRHISFPPEIAADMNVERAEASVIWAASQVQISRDGNIVSVYTDGRTNIFNLHPLSEQP